MLDTIICSGPLVWLFSPACDAVELILEGGFIFPFVDRCFVVIDSDTTY